MLNLILTKSISRSCKPSKMQLRLCHCGYVHLWLWQQGNWDSINRLYQTTTKKPNPGYRTQDHRPASISPSASSCLTKHHITNLSRFVNIFKDVHFNQSDIVLSFDVVSLFTNIPSSQSNAYKLISPWQHKPQVLDLLINCLSSSSFRWRNHLYEQIAEAAIGSPLFLEK